MKKCVKCKNEKEFIEFTKNKRSRDGRWCYCKECVSEIGRIERAKNPEKYREKSRRYRENNREKYKEICKRHYQKNIEKKKEERRKYYWANHEEVKKKANERSKTPEFRIRAKEYREKNKQVIKRQSNAHRLVQYAVKLGILHKPNVCEECLEISDKIDGHHHDYDKPLEVKWVCRKCHRKQEKK